MLFIEYYLINNIYHVYLYIMNIKKELWNNIKKIRKNKGMSQEQLAEKSTLHRTYISTVESWFKNISVENIQKIALALEINVKDLFN
jgi:transcriptional regulator with XRE-family HTH domain